MADLPGKLLAGCGKNPVAAGNRALRLPVSSPGPLNHQARRCYIPYVKTILEKYIYGSSCYLTEVQGSRTENPYLLNMRGKALGGSQRRPTWFKFLLRPGDDQGLCEKSSRGDPDRPFIEARVAAGNGIKQHIHFRRVNGAGQHGSSPPYRH